MAQAFALMAGRPGALAQTRAREADASAQTWTRGVRLCASVRKLACEPPMAPVQAARGGASGDHPVVLVGEWSVRHVHPGRTAIQTAYHKAEQAECAALYC